MAYTVLARRYRSQSFDEVVGQEPIARTLRSAVERDRLAHAYLFCGTRGVGKTSMARILAKVLNGNPEAGPEDAVNQAIMSGQDTDVIEIDGASNNRVEEARELIANSIYRPLRGRYKIYIIDEVHMLTTAAFNALLKTMEEPPEHVKFILCTTEAHKVPATIQSRCQRFDFKPISTKAIASHLTEVLAHEGVEADVDLVHQLARLGSGSMRDSLSILDRLLASGEERLTLGLLSELLGLPEREAVDRLIDAIAGGDLRGALEASEALLLEGATVEMVLETLAERFRDLMVLCACGAETELVDLPEETRRREAERAGGFDVAGLTHLIALCDATGRNVKTSAASRALFDAGVARMAMTEHMADLTRVLSGDELNGKASGGGGGPRSKKR